MHLSEAPSAVLRSLPRVDGCDLVFSTTTKRLTVADQVEPRGNRRREPSPISGFSQAKRYLDTAIARARAEAAANFGRKPPPMACWRLHDLRRTGVTTRRGSVSTASLSISCLRTSRPC